MKINESKLNKIINESVRRTLRESSEDYNRFGVWDLVEELKEYLGADDLINRICGRMDPMTLSKMLRDIKSVEIGDNDDEIVSESENMEGDFKKYYMLLSRLQQDCKYYLGHGNRHPNSLWAHDEQEQIDKMRELYDMLPVKPEWITPEDIDNYAKEMGVYSNTDVNESVNKIVNESKEQNEVILQSVNTEYFKTSKTANPIYKVCGETLDGEEFCGYTSPNASCAYVCRGLSSEHLRRKQQYLKITYHFTPKGIKSIDFMDFIDKY